MRPVQVHGRCSGDGDRDHFTCPHLPACQFYKNEAKVDEFSGASEEKIREAIAKHNK